MTISMIAVLGKNRVLGKDNNLIWRLPADLKRFRELTTGHTVIMGSKTHHSIGKPLPERENIVLSRNPRFRAEGCLVLDSLEKVLEKSKNEEEVFIIGGGKVYESALPMAHRLYLTWVDDESPGDTYFPKIDEDEWKLISSERHEADEKNEKDYTFNVYERKK